MQSLIEAIHLLSFILTLLILADIVVSFFLNPFHPIRQTLDSIVSPMLQPIQRLLPQVGMFDFSPVILLVIIQVIENILVQLLVGIA